MGLCVQITISISITLSWSQRSTYHTFMPVHEFYLIMCPLHVTSYIIYATTAALTTVLYNLLGSSIFSPLLKKKKFLQTITFHLSVSILAYVFWNCILRYTPYLGSRYYSDARKRFPDPGDHAFCVIFMTWNLLGPMNVPALADQISFLILLYLLVKKICILLLNPLNCQTLDRTTIWTNGGYVD